jgi:hypothetical protein
VADRDRHRTRERVGELVPDPLQQLLCRDASALGRDQHFEDAELLRTEIERPARTRGPSLGRVDDEVTDREHRRDEGMGAACERADAGDEDGEVERLAEVVVRAETETLDQVLRFSCGSQHQHPATALRGDELRAHLVAVHSWKVAIEHEHVVVVEQCPLEPTGPVERDVDGHLFRRAFKPTSNLAKRE